MIAMMSAHIEAVASTLADFVLLVFPFLPQSLATHPEQWGSGLGQELMDFAKNFAREEKYESVRLDTFSLNKRNHKFYEARGYQRLGNIYFPKQSEAPFYCYELLL